MTALTAETRDRLLAIQDFAIRLMFCERTLEAYRDNPDAALSERGLTPEIKAQLPDVTSPQFLAEARGRRLLHERTLGQVFQHTMQVLSEINDPALSFDAFTASDHFLTPYYALPHPTGTGPGYEAVSKYFFWLRDTAQLRAPTGNAKLRDNVYLEFTAHLMGILGKPHDPSYDRFTGGLFWPLTPGTEVPVRLLSDQLYVFTINEPQKVQQLRQIGLLNLDEIEPAPKNDAGHI